MVTVFTIVFAFAFLTLLRKTLTDEVDDSATEIVEDIALEATQGVLPNLSAGPAEGDGFIQVVNAARQVTEASSNVIGKAPVDWTGPAQMTIRTIGSPVDGLDGDFRVAAVSAQTPTGPVIVYVGRGVKNVNHDLFVAAVMLGVGLPVVVALVGTTTWFLVGRALKPVESIRQEVADITGSGLHRRVPQPATRDEIARLASTMNGMLDRLEAATERQRRFVDDASHELRSPLAVLRGELEIALNHGDTADWRAVAARMLGDVSRQERLVHDLLFMARAEHGGKGGPDVLVDLDVVVFEEVERVRIRSSAFIDVTGVSAAPVRGHAEDLARVVANLLDNAVRHAAGRVAVTVGLSGSHAELVVQDDGPGIPLHLRDEIFERFARIDEGRSRDRGGTGLGLAIASDIVQAHGGTITVEDAAVGARLVVRLPGEG
ncbi:MAG: HAMP domain-containing protein [Actinobacteria bacterium]|nr:HAMP domain-containing protein [Actinomycetota bacterium]